MFKPVLQIGKEKKYCLDDDKRWSLRYSSHQLFNKVHDLIDASDYGTSIIIKCHFAHSWGHIASCWIEDEGNWHPAWKPRFLSTEGQFILRRTPSVHLQCRRRPECVWWQRRVTFYRANRLCLCARGNDAHVTLQRTRRLHPVTRRVNRASLASNMEQKFG